MAETVIYLSELTHYFNADEYEEFGYQKAITVSQTLIYPTFQRMQIVLKYVS